MPQKEFIGRGVRLTVQAADRFYRGVSMCVVPKESIQYSSQRRRGDEAIDRLGTKVQIVRAGITVAFSSALLAPINRLTTPQTIAIVREIWIKAGDDIQTGDYLVDIKRSDHFIYLAEREYVNEDEIVGKGGIGVKCNQTIGIFRNVEKPTGAGSVKTQFEAVQRDVPVGLEFIRGGLREQEPGFYRTSTHRMFIPAYHDLREMDRIKVGEDYLRIDSVDKVTFPGVAHCAVTRDNRR